ncbi:MAG: diguanylate cyclase [Rhodobacteraceae bacterium]|nr:diguanylate cyclase [Paracoccaceae bacterium]
MNTQTTFRREIGRGREPVNRLLLGNYVRQAEIGAFGEERGIEQGLRFNVVAETLVTETGGDDVDGILSYDMLVQSIDKVLDAERLDLLETLAERIADRLLALPLVTHVTLRVEKMDRGPFQLGVEIERARPGGAGPLPERFAHAAQPLVMLVPWAAVGDARLPDWLDALAATGRPVVLTVDPAPSPVRAGTGDAQRQGDLLAMEQAAWAIAGRDARICVVESRTELNYAIDQAFLAVWAPGRIVRRAQDRRVRDDLRGRDLAAWFAGQLGVEDLRVLGAPLAEPACAP